jgi:hypothetical protein
MSENPVYDDTIEHLETLLAHLQALNGALMTQANNNGPVTPAILKQTAELIAETSEHLAELKEAGPPPPPP